MTTPSTTEKDTSSMCDSSADPLHPSQRAWMDSNHADLRARRERSVREQPVSIPLPPEGMWDVFDLQDRGIPPRLHTEFGDPSGSTPNPWKTVEYWPQEHVRAVERSSAAVMEHLARTVKTPELTARAKAERKAERIAKTTSKNAARTAQRQADDALAKEAGHPYGRDAEIRRLATPAARDKAAAGTPIFVRHGDAWKVLMQIDWAETQPGERFSVRTADGRERRVRAVSMQPVGAHNGSLMGLAAVSDTPGPAEQAEIAASNA
ncbi:MAG: hypothetical protein WAV90_00240, partial [Gordonia amarae]